MLRLLSDSAGFCVAAWLREDLHLLFSHFEGLAFYKALKWIKEHLSFALASSQQAKDWSRGATDHPFAAKPADVSLC